MPLPVHDSFTAANQNLSAYDANWVDQDAANKLRIVSNAAGTAISNGDVFAYRAETFTSDQCCQAVMSGSAANYVSLVLRGAGTVAAVNCQGYAWYASLGTLFYIGANGVVVTVATGWTTATVGDTIKFVVVGTAFTGYINSVSAGTATDSTYTSGGTPGLGVSGPAGALLDEWYGNNGTDPTGSVPVNDAKIIFRKA